MNNCPNCGGVIDSSQIKCPYCGTYYYDFSCIDAYNYLPIYIKVKIGKEIFTVLAKFTDITMENSMQPTVIRDERGRFKYNTDYSANLNLDFSVITAFKEERKWESQL